MMDNHDLLHGFPWWLFPHRGKSFNDNTAASFQGSSRYSSGTQEYRAESRLCIGCIPDTGLSAERDGLAISPGEHQQLL
jgi:hypothetical protein